MKNIAKFSTKLIKCINDKFLIHGSWIKMVYKYWKASAGNILPAHFSTGKKQTKFLLEMEFLLDTLTQSYTA